jgi:transposase InsO family protein
LRPRHQAGRLYQGRRAQGPNEVWSADFKGWWYDRQNRRCQPLTVRDEYSRYVLELRAVPDARSQTLRACFEGLFARYGLPHAIRSDNGPPFASSTGVLGLSRLSAWWVVLGIDLERGRPGCPQDNGAHERLHLDIRRELEQPAQSAQAVLEEWRQTFNQERPHEALGMRCPAECYQSSAQAYAGTPPDLSYPAGLESRKVSRCGMISWGGQWVFISEALAGWSVGLEPCAPGRWHVWFGRLLVGELDESTSGFTRAAAPSPDQNEQ